MENSWIKQYPKGVPSEINPDDYTSIVDLFEQSIARFKTLPAYQNMGSVLTFHDVDQKSQAFASFLQSNLLLKKGDRIAIMMPNLLQYPVALFGALRAGLTVVNVNPLYTSTELSYQLNDSGATTIVILSNFAKTLQDIVHETPIKNVITTEIGDFFPGFKRHFINFMVKRVKKMVPEFHLPEAIDITTAIEQGQGLTLTKPDLNNEDIAFLQYTGGTTGTSKGAMLTHRNLLANMLQAKEWCGHDLKDGEEVIVTALPLYHIFSLTANCLFFMSIGGCNILITNPRDIPKFIKTLKSNHFTAITGVNTLFNALMNHQGFSGINFSNLKLSLGGGMAVQKAVADRWKALTNTTLIEAYGLTECSPAVTINPLNLKKYNGAIGLPLPSTEVAILDDNDKPVPVNEVGQLAVRGPQVMRGYWNKEAETKAIFSKDGFLKTGDMAQMDEKGFVFIAGRQKDMILVSGFNVYPNEIEDVITKLDGVTEAAAIGVPDEKSGEAVKLIVVKSNNSLSEGDIKAHCKKHLTGYKCPKIIEFRDELPKTNVGKVLHRALRDTEKKTEQFQESFKEEYQKSRSKNDGVKTKKN